MANPFEGIINKILPMPKGSQAASQDAGTPTNPEDDVDVQRAREKAERFAQGLLSIRDLIAPSGMEVDFNFIKAGF